MKRYTDKAINQMIHELATDVSSSAMASVDAVTYDRLVEIYKKKSKRQIVEIYKENFRIL